MKYYMHGTALIVEIDDLRWYARNADQDGVRNEALNMAKRSGADMLSLFVAPDPVFPLCENKQRHRVFEFRLKEAEAPFSLQVSFVAKLNMDLYNPLDEGGRRRAIAVTREAIIKHAKKIAGRYEIHAGDTIVEKGKV